MKTDIELYTLLEDYVSEVHNDGMCFVEPYNYADFVEGLDIKDCEQGFDAYVTTGGVLCFNIDELEYFFDDFETVKEKFLERHAS